jgi:hypothetical protein
MDALCMRKITYQAQLTRPENLARVRAATPLIEQTGGRVEIMSTPTPGVAIVLLHLPEPRHPDEFLPGAPPLPFFRT